jgi:hypothetical protein
MHAAWAYTACMLAKLENTASGCTVTAETVPDHPLLRGRRELGRGEFSVVIDKGDDLAVYKVVMCPATYAFLASPDRPVGDHYPRVFADHGVIGATTMGYPIHLLEIEKLYPLPAGSEAEAIAQKIRLAYLENCRRWAHWAGEMGAMALTAMTRTPMGFSMDILDALSGLSQFVDDYHAFPDLLNKNNLMMRKDGTLVFSDPVFSG